MGLLNLPQHSCNPLDILKMDSVHLHADCKFIAEGLITLTGSSGENYFEMRARGWLSDLMLSLIERYGKVSFPSLYHLINMIEANIIKWSAHLEFMLDSKFENVRRTAGEILAKQQDSPKEFGSIIGEIYGSLSFLDDPVLLASLENPDFSLNDLCNPERTCKVFINSPAEYLGIWSPIIRTFFTVTMLYKSRAPNSPRITLIIDEAGQMGRFEALLKAFTFGRGAGIRAWAIFQDIGQIVRNFGGPALQGFIGSAQLRQFFGVRDLQTAQMVSDMLGTETLEYSDTLRQETAKRAKWQAAQKILLGNDPLGAMYDYKHFDQAAQTKTKQARKLMTPDEVLAMPENEQIVFISGKNLNPARFNKFPYYTRKEMAGLYLPNSYHPPLDTVQIKTSFGSRKLRVITEKTPKKLSQYPQYQLGIWQYIEGYKPI